MSSSEPTNGPFVAGTVAVFGVGLMGGSLAAALKRRGFSGRVLGVGRNLARLEAAREAGLLDDVSTDVDAAAAAADLLVFCTPVDQIAAGVKRAARHCRPNSLLTDAGSVKGPVCRELDGALPEHVSFVGSHPLAGSERNGWEHSRADLYEGRVCVITPMASSPREAVDRLRRLWEGVGARVIEMSPERHDIAVATTSHAPHVVAAALAAILPNEFAPLAASGFRDTTRIAAGDPDLWVAILSQNAAAVLDALDRYDQTLGAFRSALRDRRWDELRGLLDDGKRVRDELAPPSTPQNS